MNLYLLRHADAQAHLNDAVRPLSPKGWEQVAALCKFLEKDSLAGLTAIYHSPLVRAEETAQGFKDGLKLKAPMKALDELVPSGSIERVAAFLGQLETDVIAVGHNPHLEELISYLISREPSGCYVSMKKCALACLEKVSEPSKENPAGLWTLAWLVSPKILK